MIVPEDSGSRQRKKWGINKIPSLGGSPQAYLFKHIFCQISFRWFRDSLNTFCDFETILVGFETILFYLRQCWENSNTFQTIFGDKNVFWKGMSPSVINRLSVSVNITFTAIPNMPVINRTNELIQTVSYMYVLGRVQGEQYSALKFLLISSFYFHPPCFSIWTKRDLTLRIIYGLQCD